MPPNFKVTREEIIAAALKILKEQGKNSITSREIALELGVSTRPIYSFFPSMEELLEELVQEAMRLLESYVKTPYSSDPFLNIGVGYLMFGKEYPQVFDLLQEKYPSIGMDNSGNDFLKGYSEQIRVDPFYTIFNDLELRKLFLKMEIFTHGLMNYFRSGALDFTKEEIIDVLQEMGEAVIVQAVTKKLKNGELLQSDPRLHFMFAK